MEVRIAFDRPIASITAAHSVGHVISFGPARGAGDRVEKVSRPGGEIGSLRLAAARLVDAGRTLVLVTDPHPREATYSVTLPEIKGPSDPGSGLSQVVTYTLSGVEVVWASAAENGQEKMTWAGWWPDIDPSVSRAMLQGSAEHDRLWPLLKREGTLTLRSYAVLPGGKSTSIISSNDPFEATLGSGSAASGADHTAKILAEGGPDPVEMFLKITTKATTPDLVLHWAFAPEGSPIESAKGLPHDAFGLPWAPPPVADASTPPLPDAFVPTGNIERGAIVFKGEQAKCSNCHKAHGVGQAEIGPDLTSLGGSDRDWVYHNIVEPSASIHPDYFSWVVAFKDGRIAMGTVRAEGADAIRVGDIDAKFATYPRDQVEELRPSPTSIMPVGLLGAIGEEQARDLLAFLTQPTKNAARPTEPPGR